MTDTSPVPVFVQRKAFDPVADLARIRDTGGIARVTVPYTSGQSGRLITRYDDVRQVLGDAGTFGIVQSEFDQISEEEAAELRAGQLLEFDPPEHTRLRRFLTPEFTMRRMRQLQPAITAIVDAALDDVESAGAPVDLVSTFALPVPSLVICELLGVPYADRDQFQDRTLAMMDNSQSLREQTELRRDERIYMAGLVSRAQADPGEDILGTLIKDHGDDVTAAELTGIASLLLLAGHETTANMLSLGTLAMLRHPQQLAIMRDDPSGVDAAVEELLRWLSVAPTGMARTTTADVQLGGHTIPAGEQIVVSLLAANRDPAYLEAANRLDVRRGVPGHVAFGHGVHHCLGAPLARLEMRIAFPALLQRFPNLALAVPFDDIEFRGNHAVYGVHALPVTW